MDILELFSKLPTIGQAMVVIGFIMPFAVLHTFLNPEPNKPDKTKTYEVEIKSIKGEVSVKDK